MSQWTSGFISGVAATIVGFIFTMLWDIYKFRRDTNQRDESITKIVLHEIEENKTSSIENIKLIEEELSILDKKKEIIRPLLLMKSGFWDILKGSTPKKLIKNTELIENRGQNTIVANIREYCDLTPITPITVFPFYNIQGILMYGQECRLYRK